MSAPCPNCDGDEVKLIAPPDYSTGCDYWEFECQDCGFYFGLSDDDYKRMKEDCAE